MNRRRKSPAVVGSGNSRAPEPVHQRHVVARPIHGRLESLTRTRLLLLTKLDRYESPTAWDSKPLHAALAAVSADYGTLRNRHVALHSAMYDRSRLDLNDVAVIRADQTEFYRTNASWLLQYAYVRCGDRQWAEDLVQETFVRLTASFNVEANAM